MDFLTILMEAKAPKKAPPKTKTIKIKPEENEDDYTDDVPEQETKDTGDDDSTDYTDGTEDDNGDDNEDSTDYTDEEIDVEPDTDEEDDSTDTDGDDGDEEETSDESADENNDESTDYTDSDDDSSTDDTDTGTNADGTSTDDTQDNGDDIKNKLIINDFISLYYMCKNTISKLSNIDKSDIYINKIVTQVISNLLVMQKQLFDFITIVFFQNKFVTNLYQYNYFLEAFKINVEMLKKISVFMTNK